MGSGNESAGRPRARARARTRARTRACVRARTSHPSPSSHRPSSLARSAAMRFSSSARAASSISSSGSGSGSGGGGGLGLGAGGGAAGAAGAAAGGRGGTGADTFMAATPSAMEAAPVGECVRGSGVMVCGREVGRGGGGRHLERVGERAGESIDGRADKTLEPPRGAGTLQAAHPQWPEHGPGCGRPARRGQMARASPLLTLAHSPGSAISASAPAAAGGGAGTAAGAAAPSATASSAGAPPPGVQVGAVGLKEKEAALGFISWSVRGAVRETRV